MRPPRRRTIAAVAAGLAAVASAACSSGPPPQEEPTAASSPPSATSRAPTGGPTGRSAPPPGPVTIAVAGDVHFEGVLRERLATPANALAPATEALAAADVGVVNLETSVGVGGRPEPGKRYTFQAPPAAFTALAAAGVDVATMANNHALDFGREVLPATFDAIAAAAAADPPLAVVGIGRDADHAFRPARIDVEGTLVAVLGATVADEDPTADRTGHWAATDTRPGTADALDPSRLLRAVGAARRTADVLVVYLHWGVQGESCPSDSQRALAERLIAAGADVVVGSHTHTLQGDGRLGDGYVAYGLGNFVWYTGSAEPTGVLTLTVRPPRASAGRARVTGAEWAPATIGGDGLPVPLARRGGFDDQLSALRACAGLSPP